MIMITSRAALFFGFLALFGFPQVALAGDVEVTLVLPSGAKQENYKNSFSIANDMKEFPSIVSERLDFSEIGFDVFNLKIDENDLPNLLSKGYEVVPPLFVELFSAASCGETPDNLQPYTDVNSKPDVQPSICSIVGNPVRVNPTTLPSVWILDSGVDQLATSSGLLNVVAGINCVQGACAPGANVKDNLGHGTMIAGIVGGNWVNNAGAMTGMAGIAPGIGLKIIKITNKEGAINFAKAPLRALEYLMDNVDSGVVRPGDIAVISWGFAFMENARKNKYNVTLDAMDKILHFLADHQVRVVMAAGNADSAEAWDRWPWVQSFAPANSAPYESPFAGNPVNNKPKGGLFNVSASVTSYAGTQWTDGLWTGSAFGAKYSQPGFDVTSLWISDGTQLKKNKCSGSSFAAPSFAGLLALGPLPATTRPTASQSPYSGSDKVVYKHAGTPNVTVGDHPKCTN